VKVRYVNHLHNYQYMKAYTLVLVPVLALFLGALYGLCRGRRGGRLAVAACMAWMAIQGCGYPARYAGEATPLARSPAPLGRSRAAAVWDNRGWVATSFGFDKLGYASLVPLNWLNLDWELPHLAPHAGKRVGIWCARADLERRRPAGRGLPVLYADEQVALI